MILSAALLHSARSPGESSGILGAAPSVPQGLAGFVTNFLDTLEIGSFASTPTLFKLKQMVPDEQLPGPLNVRHTRPTIFQAILYIARKEVSPRTLLVLLIIPAVSGAWWGAGIVARLPRSLVQREAGSALVASVGVLSMAGLHLFPHGETRHSLDGTGRLLATLGSCLFGALGSLDVGSYALCAILVSRLGMSPLTTFPITMSSSAFPLPTASTRFLAKNSFDVRAGAGLALGGLPAVLVAAIVVKSLTLDSLRWLLIAAADCAAIPLFHSAGHKTEFVSAASPSRWLGSLS